MFSISATISRTTYIIFPSRQSRSGTLSLATTLTTPFKKKNFQFSSHSHSTSTTHVIVGVYVYALPVFYAFLSCKPTFHRNRHAARDADVSKPEMSVDEAVEHARRAFALKQFEKAVEYYATALESMYVASRSQTRRTVPLNVFFLALSLPQHKTVWRRCARDS